METWRIDTQAQTIELASSGGIPEVIHWGPRLPDSEDLAQLTLASVQDLTGGMIDALPALSLTPEAGRAFQGQPGLMLAEADGNRLLPLVDAAQTRGTYALFDRLRAAHPMVELESCASGGGRIDAGILARTQRVWLSDSNDALERLRIQHKAALFLPAAVTGSHVGPQKSHTSGRILSMKFRACAAAQRHLGCEMDLREPTADECKTLTEVTNWWKENRDWMMAGTIHRLDAADPVVIAEQQLAEDGSRFVVFAASPKPQPKSCPAPCASPPLTRRPATKSPCATAPRPRANRAAPTR